MTESDQNQQQIPSTVPQPEPVTPGITKGMVREHAFQLFRDRLPHRPLTLEDWILAEKDLVEKLQQQEAEEK